MHGSICSNVCVCLNETPKKCVSSISFFSTYISLASTDRREDTMPCNLNRVVGFNIRLSFRLSELMHDMRKKNSMSNGGISFRCFALLFFLNTARFISAFSFHATRLANSFVHYQLLVSCALLFLLSRYYF